ncbi:MAG: hypothetical protein KC591_09785 [Gemmatimonadetes bacterium]|nr:hypothetical protein [Gemmatimonadota bacterium]
MSTPLRTAGLLAAGLMVASFAAGSPAAAEVQIGGFVEGAWGARTARSPVHVDQRDWMLSEIRAQLQLSSYGDRGEAFARVDIVEDEITDDGTHVEVREGWARFTTFGDHLEVKAGRQALTWGTGDLVFVNDLFPKDWESFFLGREDQYLKAPSDAVRLGLFGLPFNVDFVYTPQFTGDRLPNPGPRFSFVPPANTLPPTTPEETFDNSEVALRVSRWLGSWASNLYWYHGFAKTPTGVIQTPATPSDTFRPFHPALDVYGASLRGDVAGTITWIEGGWTVGAEDGGPGANGTTVIVPPDLASWIVGVERQLFPDFTTGVQWFGTRTLPDEGDGETSHLGTIRIEKMARGQTLRLSLFAFYSFTDEDSYLRPLVTYKPADELELALGANVFGGDEGRFAPFDVDDNLYTRIRWSF